jgi:endonuclease-3
MKRKQIHALFARLQAANPAPTTELRYTTPFELLVAVMLSAQATDVAVNRATARLFRVAGTPEAMERLGEEGLAEHIKSIGLYNSKARHIIRTSRLLLERHEGQVPRSREALEALPGVGRKTANVVLNTAFGESTIAVDTHILRVANRTGLALGKTPREVETGLSRRVPAQFRRHAHHWLILHGRYVCTARRPRCWECPIEDLCEYPAKNLVLPGPASARGGSRGAAGSEQAAASGVAGAGEPSA